MADEATFDGDDTTLPHGERAEAARRLLEERVEAVRAAADRELEPLDPEATPTRPESRSYLLEEACELYLNELNWEELTDEERISDGSLTEMVFPGLLTFLDALLPRSGAGEPDRNQEHADVVQDFLIWLGDRLLRLRSAEPEDRDDELRMEREARIVDDLMNLVLARLYRLDQEETARLQG